MPETVSKQFLLPNTRQSIMPYVQEVVAFVSKNLPAHANARTVSFKVEVIIIELLTNGIKHAGTLDTFLTITIDDAINIEKRDLGRRFQPGDMYSLPAHNASYKKLLSHDGLHNMYALLEDNNLIRFICEEVNDGISIDVSNLMEHFGLLIITKSADEFTYHYDTVTGLNTFSVRINLH